MHVKSTLVVIAALAVNLSSGALAAPAAQGPDGAAFYVPPQPLPKGPRGSVIWQRPFAGTMALPSAASTTLVLYRSTDAQGRVVPVTGTVSIPKGEAPKGGWPVITWAHGTTGLAPACAPSLDDDKGPEHPYIADIRTLVDGFVAKGYAVVASDYQGLGVAGFQPFLQGVPTGRNTLDMLRAARTIEPKIGTRYAVMGHSQGGHVELFAAAQGPSYVPEFKLLGNVAFAPGSQIKGRLDFVMKSDKVELSLPYVLYVLQSYATNHREIDLKKILTPQAIAQLPVLMDGCMTKALSTGYWSTAIARDQFVAKPDLKPFLRVAAQNEPGTLRIASPTMVVQGKADVTVFPADTDTTVRALCAKGNVIDYRPIAGADHNGSMKNGAQPAHDFIEARFAGKKAASACKALPKAGP